jgi:hypothetical protein
LTRDEIGRQRGQAVGLPSRPPVFNRSVFAFDMAGVTEALVEKGIQRSIGLGPGAAKKTDDARPLCGHRTPPREQPSGEHKDQIAPSDDRPRYRGARGVSHSLCPLIAWLLCPRTLTATLGLPLSLAFVRADPVLDLKWCFIFASDPRTVSLFHDAAGRAA